MTSSSHRNGLQRVFSFVDNPYEGLVCDCFHGRLDGHEGPNQVLMCEDAPWWCPKVDQPHRWCKPPYCNTGVRLDEFDPAYPTCSEHNQVKD